jgi:hypothetical protein
LTPSVNFFCVWVCRSSGRRRSRCRWRWPARRCPRRSASTRVTSSMCWRCISTRTRLCTRKVGLENKKEKLKKNKNKIDVNWGVCGGCLSFFPFLFLSFFEGMGWPKEKKVTITVMRAFCFSIVAGPILGYCKGHAVYVLLSLEATGFWCSLIEFFFHLSPFARYPRSSVKPLQSREAWLKLGRVIIDHQEPAKICKPSGYSRLLPGT